MLLYSLFFAIVLLVTAGSSWAGHTELDPTFGDGGIAEYDLSSSLSSVGVTNAVLQSDGRIVVLGGARSVGLKEVAVVARFEPDGDPDTTFGTSGVVTFELEDATQTGAAAVAEHEGGLVVTGTVFGPFHADLYLARFDENGDLDAGFGVGGVVRFGTGTLDGIAEVGSAVAVQDDGKILVAGRLGGDLLLLRYDASGTPDPTFDGDGIVVTDDSIAVEATALAVQPDDKILVGARLSNGFDFDGAAVLRYETGGALDPTFGSGGVTARVGVDIGIGVALASDGKIVVAGCFETGVERLATRVARFTQDGMLDPFFGGSGNTIVDFNGRTCLGRADFQSDGKIVLTGSQRFLPPPPELPNEVSEIALVRLPAHGGVDAGFDGDGLVTARLRGGGAAVLVQPSDKILVAATHFPPQASGRFAVMRYDVESLCPAAPSPSCDEGFERGLLKVARVGQRRTLKETFLNGPVVSQAELGDPTVAGGTSYALCIYDQGDVLVGSIGVDGAGELCDGKPCWGSLGSSPPNGRGYSYRDKELASDGAQALNLNAGLGRRSKIILKARNDIPKDRRELPFNIEDRLRSSASATMQFFGRDLARCLSFALTDVEVRQFAAANVLQVTAK